MDWKKFMYDENEKPLDRIVLDGGYTRVFRTIGCIGDSLSSGTHESRDANGGLNCVDMFDYSWGQYISRDTGIKVYNFSRGGMTAKWYMESFADSIGAWDADKLCQGYIIAMGVNDLWSTQELGSVADIDMEDYRNNKDTFAGCYAQIIQKLKTLQPDAKFFLVTLPKGDKLNVEGHAKILRDMAEIFSNTYVLDFAKYGFVYDDDFKSKFYLGEHLNAAGYIFTAQLITSYIDYIIRHNFEDFSQVGFIGTPYKNTKSE